MATGRSRTEVSFIDKGINAGSKSGITIGCAFFPKMGPLGVSAISNYSDLLARYTPNGKLERGFSIEYPRLQTILRRNKDVLVSRVIETPKNAAIVFYWDSFSNQIKLKSTVLDYNSKYTFVNNSEFLCISTKHPGSWANSCGIQISKGTVENTIKLELVFALFEDKKSLITSGGYVVETFDNLHFDHTNIDNFIESTINYDSQFLTVQYNKNSTAEPINALKNLPKNGVMNSIKTTVELQNKGSNNLGTDPVEIPGTFEADKYTVTISNYVKDNLYVIYVNGNRYEVSNVDTLENCLNTFVANISNTEPNIKVSKTAENNGLEFVEKLGKITFTPEGNEITKLTVVDGIPNQEYKFQLLNEEFSVKFLSDELDADLNKRLLAAEISTQLTDVLDNIEILVVDNIITIKRLDPNLNLKATLIYPVTKLLSNLLIPRVSVLNYKINNGIIDSSTVSSKYVFKNIVDFDGASGHTYSSLSIFGSKNPTLSTLNYVKPDGTFNTNEVISSLENQGKIDLLPYSIWDASSYKFRNDELLLFVSKNPGDWGNDISISISSPNDPRLRYTNTFIVDISFKNYTETFEVSLSKHATNGYNQSMYIEDLINTESRYVNVYINPNMEEEELTSFMPYSTSIIDTLDGLEYPIQINLTGGYDGTPLASEYIKAIREFTKADYAVRCIPSLGNEFTNYLVELGKVGYEIGALPIVSIPRNLVISGNLDNVIKYAHNLNLQENGAVFFNNTIEYNNELNYDVEITGDTHFASFAGEVVQTYGRVTEPIAGLEKTAITGVKGLIYNINSAEESRLYDNNINPLVSFNNTIYINGQKTMKLVPGFLDRINVKLYTLYKRVELQNILNRYRFRLQNPETRKEIVTELEASLQNDVNEGSIKPNFVVQCDENNNPEYNDQHELYINIQICPVESIEYIFATATLTKNTANVSMSL